MFLFLQKSLIMKWSEDKLQIGDYFYKSDSHILDLESMIQYPTFWLGNINFSNFTGNSIFRLKEAKTYRGLKLESSLNQNPILSKIYLIKNKFAKPKKKAGVI